MLKTSSSRRVHLTQTEYVLSSFVVPAGEKNSFYSSRIDWIVENVYMIAGH